MHLQGWSLKFNPLQPGVAFYNKEKQHQAVMG